MAMRKIVVVGDKTTTGVILPNANSTFSVGDAGHKVALIGGPVQCLACKSVGTIAKAGGPRRMNFLGEVALEDDIVICGCPVHPKLIASLHQTMLYDDQAESLGTVPPPAAASVAGAGLLSATPGDDETIIEQYFELVDGSGNPLGDYRYDLFSGASRVQQSGDLSSGKTIAQSGNTALGIVVWLNKSGEIKS